MEKVVVNDIGNENCDACSKDIASYVCETESIVEGEGEGQAVERGGKGSERGFEVEAEEVWEDEGEGR